MAKKRILFVCTANSARSQIAEGFARHYGGDLIQVDSAGTHPTGLNPYARQVMNEVGIDISHQSSDALVSKDLTEFDHLVTVCGDAREACPVLPPNLCSEHWPLPDPARARGNPREIANAFRLIRNQIEARVKEFLARIL